MENAEVLSETNTIKLFAKSFGVLSVGYPSAGSGWWRTRYLNAAWAESIVYSDPKDAAVMGAAYQGTAKEFEDISSDIEYLQRASDQNVWLQKNISDKDIVYGTFERLMRK